MVLLVVYVNSSWYKSLSLPIIKLEISNFGVKFYDAGNRIYDIVRDGKNSIEEMCTAFSRFAKLR